MNRRIKKKKLKEKNRKLIEMYPWLAPKNVWTGKVPDDYDYTWINWGWSKGWDYAFGDMYLKELGEAVKRSGFEDEFIILQQKEKYGQCRNYVAPTNAEIDDIIAKYEVLSENICIGCGRPDVHMIDTGWISPWCYDCYKKNWRNREKWTAEYREVTPATEEEIQAAYERDICDNGNRMADRYTRMCSSSEGMQEFLVDISKTADAIRSRWNKTHRKEAVF